MDIFDVLTMIGGICLFLFGMNLMGEALERRAGDSLRSILSKLTSNRLLGFLTGMAVTAVIQSSSATTVMVVGFVNSGLLSLAQAIGVIMGANIGTTITSWVLALGGIEGESLLLQLLKPTSFTPVLALVGIIYYMFVKNTKKKDTGLILLGFATLMFGMDTMSDAVKGLRDVPEFQQLFLLFTNPILGVLAGAILTGVIQSSSASVGILQALSATGAVSYAAAIPIIMGQNIGTTVTSLLSSVGTTRNARRAAIVHLMFNVIGTLIFLPIFWVVSEFLKPAILNEGASYWGISICHTAFNIICTAIIFPASGLLEKLVCKLVPDAKEEEKSTLLDKRLLNVPSVALERCSDLAVQMSESAATAFTQGVAILAGYTPELAALIQEKEDETDRYEDELGSFLVTLGSAHDNDSDRTESAMLLKAIGDFERIADHSVNMAEAAQELHEKGLAFSDSAKAELTVLTDAVSQVIILAFQAFRDRDLSAACHVEPLEEVVDNLKEQIRTRHILRLQEGNCSIETGFVLNDLLTCLERVSDHCSNIAGCVIDFHAHNMNTHEAIHSVKAQSTSFSSQYSAYSQQYKLP